MKKNTTEKIKKFIEISMLYGLKKNIFSCLNSEQLDVNIKDSLMALEYLINEKNIVDIGTGGGIPGIPISIFLPDSKIYLVDKNRKKCSFLKMIKKDLCLDNIYILNLEVKKLEKYDCIVSKAAFSISHLPLLVNHLNPKGRIYLWRTLKEKMELIKIFEKEGLSLKIAKEYSLNDKKDLCLYGFVKD